MNESKRVYEPADVRELLRGWLLHAHKERDRHSLAARRYDRKHVRLGVIAVSLAALVGTSVFASLNDHPNGQVVPQHWLVWIRLLAGLLSIAAAVFAALQTFLGHAGRAEQHRRAAVLAKTIIREIEDASSRADSATLDESWLDDLRRRFNEIEADAPVVNARIDAAVERRYSSVEFVSRAEALYPRMTK